MLKAFAAVNTSISEGMASSILEVGIVLSYYIEPHMLRWNVNAIFHFVYFSNVYGLFNISAAFLLFIQDLIRPLFCYLFSIFIT